MLTLISRKTLTIAVIIIALISIILVLPVKFEYKLKVQGKLLPQKEWVIYKGTDGRLTSLLTNYKTGINQSYDVTLFDRGDAMRFALSPNLHSGASVEVNDTIAFLYSNEIERQIKNLEGQLITTKAYLSLNLTGEKESIIEQEKNNFTYALKQAEEQKKIVDRLKALYEKGLVSQEEYEIAKGTYDLYEINVLISKSRLQSVQTGSKHELIEFIKAQIIVLEKELTVLKNRFEGFTILSPIPGIVNRITNSDTLLIISDTTEFVLISPIRVQDKKYINPQQKVDIYINDKRQNLSAKIIELDNIVQIVHGIQIITATAIIEGKTNEMIPGIMADCYVHTGSLTPFDYVMRMWLKMVN
jgi:hypothetical protein